MQKQSLNFNELENENKCKDFPNKETIDAIIEAQKMENDPKVNTYRNIDDLIRDLIK